MENYNEELRGPHSNNFRVTKAGNVAINLFCTELINHYSMKTYGGVGVVLNSGLLRPEASREETIRITFRGIHESEDRTGSGWSPVKALCGFCNKYSGSLKNS
jgi:hypothetical protein